MNSITSKIRVFLYMLRQGIKSVFQNLFMIFASLSVIFASLLIIGSLISIAENVQAVIDDYSSRAEIKINFMSHITEEECLAVRDNLLKDERVDDIVFISAEENMKGMLETFNQEGKGDLFEGYENNENLMYVSLEVNLKKASDGDEFETMITSNIEGVDTVTNALSVINKLQTAKVIISTCSLVAVLLMGCVSIMLVFNTVKLTVFARKREIEIMKYIGATDVYIVGPFIIEGFFVGTVSAILSYGVLKGLYSLVYSYFTEKMILGDSIQLVAFGDLSINFLLWFIVGGIAVGVAASSLAVKRHVQV